MSFLDEDDLANNANLLYVALLALSAITVFRRELSPNHRFTTEDPPPQGHLPEAASASASASGAAAAAAALAAPTPDIDWKEIESVLDGTGVLGAPLALVLVWVSLGSMNNPLSASTTSPSMKKKRATRNRGALLGADDEGEGGPRSSSAEDGAAEVPIHVEPGEDLWKVLPNDVQVQALSFLHPRDVMAFATVSRSCQAIKESPALWKRLWLRDYGWVMTCWEPGKLALERSGVSLLEFDDYSARFYCCFAHCFLPYVLASHNTTESCLVGLGGHVYDLTAFLPAHPGSQETVLVNAGRCATAFFAGIRHSFTAQKLAQKLCVLVDMGKLHGHHASGLRPTMHTKLVESPYFSCSHQLKALAPISTDFNPSSLAATANGTAAAAVAASAESRPSTPGAAAGSQHDGAAAAATTMGSLAQIRDELRRQEVTAKDVAMQRYSQFSPLRDCHVYLDPFTGRWVTWYTDHSFNNIFENL